jgi:hypothetical protein
MTTHKMVREILLQSYQEFIELVAHRCYLPTQEVEKIVISLHFEIIDPLKDRIAKAVEDRHGKQSLDRAGSWPVVAEEDLTDI